MTPIPPPLPPPLPVRPHGADSQPEQSQAQQLMKWLLIPLSCIIVMLIFLLAMLILRPAGGSNNGNASEGKAIGAQSRSTGEGAAANGPNSDAGGKVTTGEATTAAPDKLEAAPSVGADAAPTEPAPKDRPARATTDSPPTKAPDEIPAIGLFMPNESENSPVVGSLAPGGENPFLSRQNEASTVFVIDKSSSMAGGNLNRVIAALEEAIDLLKETQSFQVVFFDTQPSYNPKLPDLSPATATNKRIAIDWMHQIQADGGTEPLEAMLAAIQTRPVRIVLLSDGEFDPNYASTITQTNHAEAGTAIRIDCVGVAEIVASLQEIARDNGPGIYFQAK